jgi:hypothetical protein
MYPIERMVTHQAQRSCLWLRSRRRGRRCTVGAGHDSRCCPLDVDASYDTALLSCCWLDDVISPVTPSLNDAFDSVNRPGLPGASEVESCIILILARIPSFHGARETVLQGIDRMRAEAVDLGEASQHILATNIIAELDLPLLDDSSMDGCRTGHRSQ